MNKSKKTAVEYVLDNKCPSCGANLKFNPEKQLWLCEFCKISYTLDDLKDHNNASSEKNNEDLPNDENVTFDLYKCKNCGAEIIADSTTTATFCVYCRNTSIIKSRLSNEFKPDLIIPFAKTKENAIEAFKSIIKDKKFAPRNFTDLKNIESIKGVYVPFWLYDTTSNGKLACKCTAVSSWRSGYYDYTTTKIYDVKRNATMNFVKVPVDGSSKFVNDVMNSIEPFNYKGLKEYNHAYLSGFYAEMYDVSSEEAYDDAKKRIEATTKNVMFEDIKGYTSRNPITSSVETKNMKKYYALLPVWMLNVKFNNKLYPFAMNGQDGKFIGNIPVDNKKAFLYFLKIFLIMFVSIILIFYISYLIGELL